MHFTLTHLPAAESPAATGVAGGGGGGDGGGVPPDAEQHLGRQLFISCSQPAGQHRYHDCYIEIISRLRCTCRSCSAAPLVQGSQIGSSHVQPIQPAGQGGSCAQRGLQVSGCSAALWGGDFQSVLCSLQVAANSTRCHGRACAAYTCLKCRAHTCAIDSRKRDKHGQLSKVVMLDYTASRLQDRTALHVLQAVPVVSMHCCMLRCTCCWV